MDLGLQDRVALVVGGTGYIGSAIAERLAAEGANVLTASRSGSGDITLDAHDPAAVESAVAKILDEHGRLDIVVVTAAPSAGTIDPARLDDAELVAEQVDAKALSFLRVAKAVLPGMRAAGFGRVVGISGQNAYVTGSIVGSVRNAALLVIAKNLADSVAGSGVTVNVVNPGGVVADPSSDVRLGRPGESTPQQIAALVAFLASEPAAAISGEAISTGHKLRGSAVI